tara:strand:+ start:161 stop:679 length:519 start_codon:yes stop_codon:yes gene_type:complete
MDILPDVIKQGLTTVFCGSAASTVSAQLGAYYSGPGNRFWQTLYETGLTPDLFSSADYHKLSVLGIGLTDLAKSKFGRDSNISSMDYDSRKLLRKIEKYRPKVIAFTGKRPAQHFFFFTRGQTIKNYGEQTAQIGKTRIFVLPSPSGAARRWWSVKPWDTLAQAHRQEWGKE